MLLHVGCVYIGTHVDTHTHLRDFYQHNSTLLV
jgi:hypothetical protein